MAKAKLSGKLMDGVSLSADATSDILSMDGCLCASLHMISAAAARAGTITIESSNDGTNWAAEQWHGTTSSLAVVASTAFNEMVHLGSRGGGGGFGALFVRVVFTDSAAGAGTMTIHAVRKVR